MEETGPITCLLCGGSGLATQNAPPLPQGEADHSRALL
jgi:hypothetical protein